MIVLMEKMITITRHRGESEHEVWKLIIPPQPSLELGRLECDLPGATSDTECIIICLTPVREWRLARNLLLIGLYQE